MLHSKNEDRLVGSHKPTLCLILLYYHILIIITIFPNMRRSCNRWLSEYTDSWYSPHNTIRTINIVQYNFIMMPQPIYLSRLVVCLQNFPIHILSRNLIWWILKYLFYNMALIPCIVLQFLLYTQKFCIYLSCPHHAEFPLRGGTIPPPPRFKNLNGNLWFVAPFGVTYLCSYDLI